MGLTFLSLGAFFVFVFSPEQHSTHSGGHRNAKAEVPKLESWIGSARDQIGFAGMVNPYHFEERTTSTVPVTGTLCWLTTDMLLPR
jgi:hypothetical protein